MSSDELPDYFVILGILSRGGLGTTYQARDVRRGREVAIKVHNSADEHVRSLVFQEAQMLSAISHPLIAQFYEYGLTKGGAPYIATELVTGNSIADLLRQQLLTLTQSLRIALSVAETLAALHNRGVVHRDIKPANILLDKEARIKIVDFGLHRNLAISDLLDPPPPDDSTTGIIIGATGPIVGSPYVAAYVAPEQVTDIRPDTRSDVFSLGATLYEFLTGRQAFRGNSVQEVLKHIVLDNPPMPSLINTRVPKELDRIVLKALAKKPSHRYQSAVDLASDLQSVRGLVQKADKQKQLPQRSGVKSLYFTLEGEQVKGNRVVYGSEVDLVFNFAPPPVEALIAFWGERFETVLKQDVDLGITVIADGFTFTDNIWHRFAKFRNGELEETVRFHLRSLDRSAITDLSEADGFYRGGFFIVLSLYGTVLYQFPLSILLVDTLEMASPSTTSDWSLDLSLNEIIAEKEAALPI